MKKIIFSLIIIFIGLFLYGHYSMYNKKMERTKNEQNLKNFLTFFVIVFFRRGGFFIIIVSKDFA